MSHRCHLSVLGLASPAAEHQVCAAFQHVGPWTPEEDPSPPTEEPEGYFGAEQKEPGLQAQFPHLCSGGRHTFPLNSAIQRSILQ